MDRSALTPENLLTLEALADTMVPGRKRFPEDVAIAGVHDTPGAVEAGAIDVLLDPATGIDDGVVGMADLLNERAREYVTRGSDSEQPAGPTATESPDGLPAFVALPYAQRRALYAELTDSSNPEREIWFLVGLFAYMAFDSAPHLETAEAMRSQHPGLLQLGFAQPDPDGLWRNPHHSYTRPLSRAHPMTDEKGDIT